MFPRPDWNSGSEWLWLGLFFRESGELFGVHYHLIPLHSALGAKGTKGEGNIPNSETVSLFPMRTTTAIP
jgi:hypothetical protein